MVLQKEFEMSNDRNESSQLSADPVAVEPVATRMNRQTGMWEGPEEYPEEEEIRIMLKDGAEAHKICDFVVRLCNEREAARAIQPVAVGGREAFQIRVSPWMQACFGPEISRDTSERNHRFLEEALELVQACGCTAHEAHQLVDYTFGRLLGDPEQEVGGVMVTLAALCLAQGFDMHTCGETELARIWTKVDAIRAKQAAKPKHSPLPIHSTPKAGESS